MQMLSNAVTCGLIVEYIRNPDATAIARTKRIWRAQMLATIFGPE
jgi:hypothetical protein